MNEHPESTAENLETATGEPLPGPDLELSDEEQTALEAPGEPAPVLSVKEIPFEIFTGYSESEDHPDREHVAGLLERLVAVEQHMVQLGAEFQSKIKYDAHKDKIIDNLHAELQTYKNGVLEKILRPVFMDIIEVIDDTRRLLKDLKSNGQEDNPEKLKKFLEAVPGDLEDLLYKHGVEVVQSKNEVFDPAVQKAVRVMPTQEENLDKAIGERLKNGYSWEGKLLRHEVVNIWQFQKPL